MGCIRNLVYLFPTFTALKNVAFIGALESQKTLPFTRKASSAQGREGT